MTEPTRDIPHGVRCFKALARAAVDPCLSRGDLGCLAVILDRFNVQEGAAWPSINRLAKEAGISARNVVTCIKRLADLGYLAIDSGSSTRSNRYRPTFKATEADFSTEAQISTEPEFSDLLKPASLQVLKRTSYKHTHRTYPKNLPSKCTRFADFWQAYPRKTGSKQKAEKSWARQDLDHIADQLITNVTERAASDPRWSDRQYIPHPLTYLNNQRWNDEWTPQARRPSTTDNFTNTEYQGSTDAELPDCLRSNP